MRTILPLQELEESEKMWSAEGFSLNDIEPIGELIHDSKNSIIFLVNHRVHGKVVLKTLDGMFRNEDYLHNLKKHVPVISQRPFLMPLMIGKYSGYSEDDNIYWYFMEYMEGESLSSLMDRNGKLTYDSMMHANALSTYLDSLVHLHKHGLRAVDVNSGAVITNRASVDEVVSATCDLDLISDISTIENNCTEGIVLGVPEYLSRRAITGRLVTPVDELESWALVAEETFIGTPWRWEFAGENVDYMLIAAVNEGEYPQHRWEKLPPQIRRPMRLLLNAGRPNNDATYEMVVDYLKRGLKEYADQASRTE